MSFLTKLSPNTTQDKIDPTDKSQTTMSISEKAKKKSCFKK